MQFQVSDKMGKILEEALQLSAGRGHFYVGVEHLFIAVMDHAEDFPESFRNQYRDVLMNVAREAGRTAWNGHAGDTVHEMFHTPRCINVIQQATRLSNRYGSDAADAGHLLCAMLADTRSAPSRILDAMGFDRGACLAQLTAELGTAGMAKRKALDTAGGTQSRKKTRSPAGPDAVSTAPTELQESAGAAADTVLSTLTRDLNALARKGKLQPAIDRNSEILEILQVLSRKSKNNVMLVGEAGVGKTQIVEGIAYYLARGGGSNGQAPSFRILELNMAALMAGTQYRGSFEERLLALLDRLQSDRDTVLFIDEAHLIMGAGATEGDGMDLANLLKPALARGEIRCIGATTLREYRKLVEKDPAMERRFQLVRIEEMSEEATVEVLKRLVPALKKHHRVEISEQAIEAAVTLTQRHMPNRYLPDKAIDVLDQACARFRLKLLALRKSSKAANTAAPDADEGVTPHEIRKVISRMTAIPIEELTAEERLHLGRLEGRIKLRLIGQDEAVAKAVAAVKKSRAGLADPNRPDAVLLFLGPSGVGKTQLAKLLAEYLFGSANHLITFDMSEYIEEHSVSRLLGAPPGYADSDEEGRLSEAVRNSPFSILLFDEIEKAHPRIFDIFLPIFDEGRLKDARGRDVSFRNCIIIMTSNIGADLMRDSGTSDPRAALMEELRGHFRPEFINRIDDIIPFYPLLNEDVRSLLRLEINVLRERLKDRAILLRMFHSAYAHLITRGYSPEFGARDLRRIVDREITLPVSDLLLKGEFVSGDVINVLERDGALVFLKGGLDKDEERRRRKCP